MQLKAMRQDRLEYSKAISHSSHSYSELQEGNDMLSVHDLFALIHVHSWRTRQIVFRRIPVYPGSPSITRIDVM